MLLYNPLHVLSINMSIFRRTNFIITASVIVTFFKRPYSMPDENRVIALSTLRQLGLMIIIIYNDLSGLAFFHLLIHALFKALLFICAGGVIHSIGDSQDIRFMGGLPVYMPFTSSSLMVSNFALCGMPFLAGFYFRVVFYEIFKYAWFLLLFVSTGLAVCSLPAYCAAVYRE